jgi:hypothetical protein
MNLSRVVPELDTPGTVGDVQVEFEVEIRSPNRHHNQHWKTRAWGNKKARKRTGIALHGYRVPALPVRVTLTRLGYTPIDADNLAMSFKAIRDETADFLGLSDRDPRVEWVYAHEHLAEKVRGMLGYVGAGRAGAKAKPASVYLTKARILIESVRAESKHEVKKAYKASAKSKWVTCPDGSRAYSNASGWKDIREEQMERAATERELEEMRIALSEVHPTEVGINAPPLDWLLKKTNAPMAPSKKEARSEKLFVGSARKTSARIELWLVRNWAGDPKRGIARGDYDMLYRAFEMRGKKTYRTRSIMFDARDCRELGNVMLDISDALCDPTKVPEVELPPEDKE